MENRYKKYKILKDLDLFIQNTIDKYFYVKPWKKLYDRTGKLHRDIISDKSTIPDLIIYNKIFNKSQCFFESNNSSYIKFPRMRFILRPKYKKEYNPSSTYGQGNEVCFIHKQNNSDDKNTFINLSLNNKMKEEKIENNSKQNLENFLEHNNILYEQNKKKEKSNLNEDVNSNNEDEPEWANDNVEDYNNVKIEFKTIPKSLEEKLVEELELSPKMNNDNDKNLEQIKEMNINNFFKSNDSNIENNDNIYQEIKDFMNIDINENNILKQEKNINNKNGISNDNYSNNKLNDNFKPHYNIFDTENKFNEFFIKFQESNDTNKEEKCNNNINNNNNTLKISDFPNNNKNNITLNELNQNKELKDNPIKNALIQEQQQKEKQKYLQMIQIQKLQNQIIENQNIILQNSPSFFFNNSSFRNNQLFKNNSNRFDYSNNLNYPNNNNIIGSLNNNYNTYNNANRFYNLNPPGYINNYIKNNNNMYINNINSNIYRNNIYQLYQNNINYNKEMLKPKDIESEINFKNINQFNNNKNIFTQNILKNAQYDRINPNFNNSSSANNNINYVNNINNLLNDIDKNNVNIYEQNNYKKGLKNAENNNKLMNPADYLNNPTLFIIKNTDRKNWLVLNTNNSIIRNFNSKELLDFLEEKVKNNMPLDEFTINDFDIDVVFPAKEIYEILKKFYYKQK